jgi:TDG/mug DNA glycosylase family protein
MNKEFTFPEYLRPGLDVIFIGINPGRRSAEIGRHFAGHSNRFWKLLAEAGLTPIRLKAEEDYRLPEFNLGLTNIVKRPTATAAELTTVELRAGAVRLRGQLTEYQPRSAAYIGKVVYQYTSGKNDFSWGRQPEQVIQGITDFVLPNPSGLNRMPYPEQLRLFQELHDWIAEVK